MLFNEKTKYLTNAVLKLALKLLLVFFLCIVFLFGLHFIPQNLTYEYYSEASSGEDEDIEADNTSESDQDKLLVLRSYNGKIGVFNSEGTLIDILDVSVEDLPGYDKALLAQGIVAVQQEINEIFEGLIS